MTELHHFHPARKGSGSLRPFPIYPLYTQTVILFLDKPIADCFLFRPRRSCEKCRKRSHTNVSNTLVTWPSTPPAQTPQRSFQRGLAGTHATPSPNRAHSGSQGETRGLLSPGHSVALCCQQNCHRKNSRRKWMHALWRVSAFSGVAAPLGCAVLLCICKTDKIRCNRFYTMVR